MKKFLNLFQLIAITFTIIAMEYPEYSYDLSPFENILNEYEEIVQILKEMNGNTSGQCPLSSCQQEFETQEALNEHFLTHLLTNAFKCPHPNCNQTYDQFRELTNHHLSHNAKECSKCNDQLINQSLKLIELRKCTAPVKQTENKPNTNYIPPDLSIKDEQASIQTFQFNLNIHHDIGDENVHNDSNTITFFTEQYSEINLNLMFGDDNKNNTCSVCSAPYQKFNDLQNHFRDNHILSSYDHKCPHQDCKKKCKSLKDLKYHHNSVHIVGCNDDCKIRLTCHSLAMKQLIQLAKVNILPLEEKQRIMAPLLGNSLLIKRIITPPNENGKRICPECSFEYSDKRNLQKHRLRSHLDTQEYLCGHAECNYKKSISYINYQDHHIVKHGKTTNCECKQQHELNYALYCNMIKALNAEGKIAITVHSKKRSHDLVLKYQ